MSLPSLNPEKTASGIIVDPKTLERVIPQSRRKDGTVRKEQKVRPGFTPQEDVGRFRSNRQVQEDVRNSTKPTIPGSNKIGTQTSKTSSENVFANELKEKTKAQIKNEKRREKRREKISMSWDEDDEDDDQNNQDGGLGEDFKNVDKQRQLNNNTTFGSEQSYPPLENNGGPPEKSLIDDLNENNENEKKENSSQENIITATTQIAPPAPSNSKPETALENKMTTNNSEKPSLLNDRKKEIKSHPIQGGRKGPIGLANPPPIEESQSQSKADQIDDWRTVKKPQRQQSNSKSGKGGKSQQQIRSNGNENRQSQSQIKPTSNTTTSQPRERKEHKIRQGGANDISSLASRVRNLVVANTVGNSKDKKEEPKTSAQNA